MSVTKSLIFYFFFTRETNLSDKNSDRKIALTVSFSVKIVIQYVLSIIYIFSENILS